MNLFTIFPSVGVTGHIKVRNLSVSVSVRKFGLSDAISLYILDLSASIRLHCLIQCSSSFTHPEVFIFLHELGIPDIKIGV